MTPGPSIPTDATKWRLGLSLAAFVFLALFLLPLTARISPEFEKWQASQPVSLTASLNPGPLSAAHRTFGRQCSACHQTALQGVADTACIGCHTRVPTHRAGGAPQKSGFRGVRCVDCHAGHEGKARAATQMTQCVDCHGKQGKDIGEVRDFGQRHPDFRLPPDKPGLKFSHKAHLRKDGVSSPLGDIVMACRDCHKAEKSGVFAAMEMETTCQQSRCHKQRFAEPLSGIIPHGSERAAMAAARSLYASRLIETPAAAAECGPKPKGVHPAKRLLDCADAQARGYAAAKLFQVGGTAPQCALCHEIAPTGEAETPWKVAPVHMQRDWHARAVFDHARHGTIDCGACHDKLDSTASADLSMPGIAKCRECHAGNRGAAAKVASGCESCHRFHRFAQPPA